MVRRKHKKKTLICIVSLFLVMTSGVPVIGFHADDIPHEIILSNRPRPSAPVNWIETQKILASEGETDDQFGFSVSIDGDTAVIGSPLDDDNGENAGSAFVYTFNGTSWIQQAILYASNGTTNGCFGYAVSLDHDTVLVSAWRDNNNGPDARCVYVFIHNGTTWTQQTRLHGSDSITDDNFGYSLSLNDNIALVGSPWDDDNGQDTGSAYLFVRNGTQWTQQQKLHASDASRGDVFGFSVSLEGDTALISARCDDDKGVDAGSVYVFTHTDSSWIQQAKLLASDGAANDWFGYSVSVSGNTAGIGASLDDDKGDNSGSTYLFTRNGNQWTQITKLVAPDGGAGDQFGHAVCLDGNTCLVSAWNDNDHGEFSGSAYVFKKLGGNWPQQAKLNASDGTVDDEFGNSVSLSDGTAFIGDRYDDDKGEDSGSVYVYLRVNEIPPLGINITGGLGIKFKIINKGTTNATNVPWLIQIHGGMFKRVNETKSGIVDIPAGETKIVGSDIFVGLGGFTITTIVGDAEQTTKGMQILILSLVKT